VSLCARECVYSEDFLCWYVYISLDYLWIFYRYHFWYSGLGCVLFHFLSFLRKKSGYGTQAGLELKKVLPEPPKCGDYRFAPPYLIYILFFDFPLGIVPSLGLCIRDRC
jgi:hypothetical protein